MTKFKYQIKINKNPWKLEIPAKQAGQTLISLLIFMVVSTTIITSAVVAIIINNLSTTKFQEGNTAYYIAESGVENALIRLLRESSYTGETLPVSDGSALIQISGGGVSPYTITSTGRVGNFMRKIQVTATNSGTLTITSWKEIY